MDIGDEGADVASVVLELTEGATDGRGPSGVLTLLVETANRMLGVSAAAATGGPDGADAGSFVAFPDDPAGALEAGFEIGPGRDCVRTGRQLICDDVASERHRWLRFVAKTTTAGLAGAWAVPLRRGDEVMGALLLAGPSGRPDLSLAGGLAEAAAVGLRHAHALHRAEAVGRQLQEALQSRVVIEQAKGALALHAGLDVEAAFVALRGHARRRGLGLTDLAHRVVAGEIELSDVTPRRPPLS